MLYRTTHVLSYYLDLIYNSVAHLLTKTQVQKRYGHETAINKQMYGYQ